MKPRWTAGLLVLVGAYAYLGGTPAELLFFALGALVVGLLMDVQDA